MAHAKARDDDQPAARPAGERDKMWAERNDAYGSLAGWHGRPRRTRRFVAVFVALGAVALLGVAVDRASGGGGLLRARSGGAAPRVALLQQGLDAYDGDDDSDDSIRDDMLATAPPSRTQSLSWLDWNEDDIAAQETYIKKSLIKIEQGLIAQPQRLNEMKVSLGHVVEYYGKTGKLQEGVPEALVSVRAQMQQAVDEIMHSEKMHKLTSDVRAIREGAKLFLQAQKTKDTLQDQLLDWTKSAQKKLKGNTYEHLKTLKRHLRGDERDVSQYRTEVKSMVGDNRRRIARGVRRKKEELEAKGKQLIIKFFGEGGKHMRRKTRGRKRKDGLWDEVEDEANANVTNGLAHTFAKWDRTAWTTKHGLDSIQSALAKQEPDMRAWHQNVTWRLDNLTEAIVYFKIMNQNITFPLSAAGRQQWKAIGELQDAIDDMAEKRAVAMDPCIGIRETAQALTVLVAMLTQRQETAQFDDLEGQKKLDAVRTAFYTLGSQQLNDADRKKTFEIILGTAAFKNSTATVVEVDTDREYRQVFCLPSSTPFHPESLAHASTLSSQAAPKNGARVHDGEG